jgi:hypothetical protein
MVSAGPTRTPAGPGPCSSYGSCVLCSSLTFFCIYHYIDCLHIQSQRVWYALAPSVHHASLPTYYIKYIDRLLTECSVSLIPHFLGIQQQNTPTKELHYSALQVPVSESGPSGQTRGIRCPNLVYIHRVFWVA